MQKREAIGIFGGTFDPVHMGHLVTAEEVLDLLGLSGIIFTPSYLSPHKHHREVASARDRYEMVRLAIGENPRFSVDDLELARGGTSYTIDTVREMAARHGDDVLLNLVVGADLMLDFGSWKDPEQVLALTKVIVMSRPGFDLAAVPDEFRGRFEVAEVTRIDISSTLIRERLSRGRSIRYLVPEAVEAYIRAKGLYRRT